MNIILFRAGEVQQNSVELTDYRAKHLIRILKAEPGKSYRVGILDGPMGVGKVVSMEKKHPFRVVMELELPEPPQQMAEIDLLLALPRPIMLRRIFSQLTSLGVGRIYLLGANRVEKSFWEAKLLHQEHYLPHLIAGLEQGVDTLLPRISIHRRFRPFIEDYLPTLAGDYGHLLCGHPHGEVALEQAVTSRSGRILLAVGPEGGWVDFEIEKMVEQGFCCCSMGTRILRVDTAAIAFHARVSALRQAICEKA